MENENNGKGHHGVLGQVKREVSTKTKQRQQHWKGMAKGKGELVEEPSGIESGEAQRETVPAIQEEAGTTNGQSAMGETSKTNGHSSAEKASKTNGHGAAHSVPT